VYLCAGVDDPCIVRAQSFGERPFLGEGVPEPSDLRGLIGATTPTSHASFGARTTTCTATATTAAAAAAAAAAARVDDHRAELSERVSEEIGVREHVSQPVDLAPRGNKLPVQLSDGFLLRAVLLLQSLVALREMLVLGVEPHRLLGDPVQLALQRRGPLQTFKLGTCKQQKKQPRNARIGEDSENVEQGNAKKNTPLQNIKING
jgi:hypothetical protein